MIVESNKGGIQEVASNPNPAPQETTTQEQNQVTPESPKSPDVIQKEPVKSQSKEDESHSGYQKRIDKLTWRNNEFQRQLEAKEREMAEIKARLDELHAKANPKQFKDETERFEHFVDSKVQEQLRKRDQEASRSAEMSSKAEKIQTKIKESLDSLKEYFPDAIETISSHQDPLPNEAFQFILASDVSGPLSYLIAKSPEVQEKLASFEDSQSLERYLLRLEIKAESLMEDARKSKSQEAAQKSPDVTQSSRQAPSIKPISPIQPKSTQFRQAAPDPSKNTSEWIRWRNEQERTKGKK